MFQSGKQHQIESLKLKVQTRQTHFKCLAMKKFPSRFKHESNQFPFIYHQLKWRPHFKALFSLFLSLSCSVRCAAGYTKSIDTKECEDINECDTGEANCDINNQACLNSIGSFKCLDILNSERTNNCEEGFRYQARIDQCVGTFNFSSHAMKPKSFFVAQSFHLFGQTNFCFHFSNQHIFCCFIYFLFCFFLAPQTL